MDGCSPGQHQWKLSPSHFSCLVPPNVKHSLMPADRHCMEMLGPIMSAGNGLNTNSLMVKADQNQADLVSCLDDGLNCSSGSIHQPITDINFGSQHDLCTHSQMEFLHQSSSVGFALGHGHVKLSGVLVYGIVDGRNHYVLVFRRSLVMLSRSTSLLRRYTWTASCG